MFVCVSGPPETIAPRPRSPSQPPLESFQPLTLYPVFTRQIPQARTLAHHLWEECWDIWGRFGADLTGAEHLIQCLSRNGEINPLCMNELGCKDMNGLKMPVRGGGGEHVCIHGCDKEGQGDPGGAQDGRAAAWPGRELRDPSRDPQGEKFSLHLLQSPAAGVTSWAPCACPDTAICSAATLQLNGEERREVNLLLQMTLK